MSNQNELAQLTAELIRRKSITPEDDGCQQLIGAKLAELGFKVEVMNFEDVKNIWAVYGQSGPLLVFAGHTDVVPPGPLEDWDSHPFLPTVRNNLMYGRGAADMKGSIAAMVQACDQFLGEDHELTGRIGFLITSDEEGPAVNGTQKVVAALQNRSEKIDWCLVGEPSSNKRLGDTIKCGRRGSLGAKLIVEGVQGHLAYPQLAVNPIHQAIPALSPLLEEEWDKGNVHFPATALQISNINAGTGATNVIPGTLSVDFNFRYSTEVTAGTLMARTEEILKASEIKYSLTWTHFGEPFLTASGALVAATQRAVKEVMGQEAELSTSGGTSDGRFIAPTGSQVVELGPINATIHKVNESTSLEDLNQLSKIYYKILTNLLL